MLLDEDFCFLGTKNLNRAIKRQHKLDERTKSLISTSQALRKYRYLPWGTRRALAKNRLLKKYAQLMAGKLTTRDLVLLSLLAGHFDSKLMPLSWGLLKFISDPHKQFDTVCRIIHLSYTTMCGPDRLANFMETLRKLLGLLEWHVIRGDAVLYI
ncbi:unnamed protein product [Penicillium salamii]|nr:unnamed protein product [Penicillium salamii]CAG8350169.1 unnamed protein product [Penicillium salamii]